MYSLLYQWLILMVLLMDTTELIYQEKILTGNGILHKNKLHVHK
jgi:hypothetical protein